MQNKTKLKLAKAFSRAEDIFMVAILVAMAGFLLWMLYSLIPDEAKLALLIIAGGTAVIAGVGYGLSKLSYWARETIKNYEENHELI